MIAFTCVIHMIAFTCIIHMIAFTCVIHMIAFTCVIHMIAKRSNVLPREKPVVLVVSECLSALSNIAPQTDMIADSHEFGQPLRVFWQSWIQCSRSC